MPADHLVGNEEFKKKVAEAGHPVMVDFYADWCGPCRMAEPIINKLAEEYAGKAGVFKLDVDDEANQELVKQFQVMSIPTTIMFTKGAETGRDIGFVGEDGYRGMIDNALKA